MKKSISTTIAIFVFVAVALAGGDKLTVKERVDNASEVKVYFNFIPVMHSPGMPGGPTEPSGCPKFKETTEFTADYKSQADKMIELLNSGLKTDKFKKADIADIPVKKEIAGIKIYDWETDAKDLVVVVTVTGSYKVSKSSIDGSLSNSINIYGQLQFFQMIDGKHKILKNGMVGNAGEAGKKTVECNDYEYFKTTFPLENYSTKFIETNNTTMAKLTSGLMKKYAKAMKKKK